MSYRGRTISLHDTRQKSPALRAKPGRPKKDENIKPLDESRGPTSQRLVARLKCDHPDIARRLAKGEFNGSAKAAARAAGIEKRRNAWLAN